jgi:hypothetical protein
MATTLDKFGYDLRLALLGVAELQSVLGVAERRIRDASAEQGTQSAGKVKRAAELARELAADVLEAIGVDAALEIEGREVPPVAAAVRERNDRLPSGGTPEEWAAAYQRERDADAGDPERQRVARTTGFAMVNATLWLAGLADADLLAGAERERAALVALERWAARRLRDRLGDGWQRVTEAIAKGREHAEQMEAQATALDAELAAERAALLWEPWLAGRWKDRIAAVALAVAEAEGTSRTPAVARPVVLAVLDPRNVQGAFWPGGRANVTSRLVATLPPETVARLAGPEASERLAMLQTVPARRFLRHLVTEGQQAEADGRAGSEGAPVVTIAGGLDTMRDWGKKIEWERLLEAGQWIEWEYQGRKFGGLWTYARDRPGPGRPAEVRVTLGELLRRNVVQKLHRDDKLLVPILQHDPPIPDGLAMQNHAAVWRLQDRLLLRMAEGWRDAEADAERYRMRDSALAILGTDAGLPERELERVLGAFADGAGDVPPLLEVETDGRGWRVVRLADPHAAERDFMAAGVRERRAASKGGQATAKRRPGGGAKGGR